MPSLCSILTTNVPLHTIFGFISLSLSLCHTHPDLSTKVSSLFVLSTPGPYHSGLAWDFFTRVVLTHRVYALHTSLCVCAAVVLGCAFRADWRSDHALRRMLGANKHDVGKAEAMLRRIVAFRNARQTWRYTDPTFYQEPEAMRRFFGWGFGGWDAEGFPVLFERTGATDLLGLLNTVGVDAFLGRFCIVTIFLLFIVFSQVLASLCHIAKISPSPLTSGCVCHHLSLFPQIGSCFTTRHMKS
jgi:hypothetical protein